jgi:hypothetical protein
MNIYSYMITKDEKDRYLFDAVKSLTSHVDGLLLYDDQSQDMTAADWRTLAGFGNVNVIIRGNARASFTEDESGFRQDAWTTMVGLFRPRLGDWIITLDADEFLRTTKPLPDICTETSSDIDVLRCKVQEVWGPDQIRIDGFWDTISAARLCRFQSGSKFANVNQGGGSIPLINVREQSSKDFDILHYGYFRPEDRAKKHERYVNTKGHNPKHIQSIIERPVLAPLPRLGYAVAA